VAGSCGHASDFSGSKMSGNILNGLATVGSSGNTQLHRSRWLVGWLVG
jgi:hypothetical protein